MVDLDKSQVRALWLKSQGLHERAHFGKGPKATAKVVKSLGYVQIDTINVIERSHHHILFSRIPDYRRSHLHQAQTVDKTVFEYWTHALSYVATEDFRYFIPAMKRRKANPSKYIGPVSAAEKSRVLRLIKKDGAISIRDITDDVLIEKDHPWQSKKPSKRVLQLCFNSGELVISERLGMVKKYELTQRHFDWQKPPKAATASEVVDYHIDRALRAQTVISLDSAGYMATAPEKKELLKKIQAREKNGLLIPVQIKDVEKEKFWIEPQYLDQEIEESAELTHLLSPFDPVVIQRKRFNMFFDYDHRFEAYVPKEKRKYGYFALPVLIGHKAVAVIDLKTDRQNKELLIQQWSWLKKHKSSKHKALIEEELHRFEKFQLQDISK